MCVKKYINNIKIYKLKDMLNTKQKRLRRKMTIIHIKKKREN